MIRVTIVPGLLVAAIMGCGSDNKSSLQSGSSIEQRIAGGCAPSHIRDMEVNKDNGYVLLCTDERIVRLNWNGRRDDDG